MSAKEPELRRRHISQQIRLLRGEDVELIARSLEATAADVSSWRDAFLEGGASNRKQCPRDAREEEIDRLRAKVGEITMDNELLHEKISKMEAGHPFARRRSKR